MDKYTKYNSSDNGKLRTSKYRSTDKAKERHKIKMRALRNKKKYPATPEMLRKIEQLVYRMERRYPWIDHEETCAECYAMIPRLYRTYMPSKSDWETYMRVRLIGKIKDLARKPYRGKYARPMINLGDSDVSTALEIVPNNPQ